MPFLPTISGFFILKDGRTPEHYLFYPYSEFRSTIPMKGDQLLHVKFEIPLNTHSANIPTNGEYLCYLSGRVQFHCPGAGDILVVLFLASMKWYPATTFLYFRNVLPSFSFYGELDESEGVLYSTDTGEYRVRLAAGGDTIKLRFVGPPGLLPPTTDVLRHTTFYVRGAKASGYEQDIQIMSLEASDLSIIYCDISDDGEQVNYRVTEVQECQSI
ncbi:hypothetical protein FRB99_004153 [Tulasnella sp. 403]|nr:hypothetical protein FRB99_004153 [Tulasnella sp. 403]